MNDQPGSCIRVFIVDDQRMFREGIRSRLEQESDIRVVGEAASAEEALRMVGQATPTIVLVDIRLPNLSGIQLAKQLKQQWPGLKLLALTGYDYDQYVRAMIRVGINGYLLKDAPQDTLVEALRAIAAGGAVLAPSVASKVIRGYATMSSEQHGRQWESLTVREIEVMELMHEGLKNTQIARRLSISPRTVEAHVSSIISKLGARDRVDAVRLALEKDLLK